MLCGRLFKDSLSQSELLLSSGSTSNTGIKKLVVLIVRV